MKNSIYQKDITSIDDLSIGDLQLLFDRTAQMEKLVKGRGGDDRLKGKIMAALFFEPSTRTFSSFITAIQRLAGGFIPLNGMKNTSIEKGESFEHTVQVFSVYADCLVIRHPEAGKPALATRYAKVPVINAGDGVGEHPTQAIFDAFTIINRFPGKKDLAVAMVGDLKNGRTVHSLAKILLKIEKNIRFYFISPESLSMPGEIKKKIQKNGFIFRETDNLKSEIKNLDVLYMTRVQKERFADMSEYEKVKSYYQLNNDLASDAKDNMIIMHPLPVAAGEIAAGMDGDKRSIYLSEQLENGLYARMALLDLILNK